MGVKCVKYVKQQTKRQQTRFKLLFSFQQWRVCMQVAAQQLKTDAGGAEQRVFASCTGAVKDSSQRSTYNGNELLNG